MPKPAQRVSDARPKQAVFAASIRQFPKRLVVVSEGDSWFSYPLNANLADNIEMMSDFSMLRLEHNGDDAVRGRAPGERHVADALAAMPDEPRWIRLVQPDALRHQRVSRSQVAYTSRASITSPETTATSTAILYHVSIQLDTALGSASHTATSPHTTSETTNASRVGRINLFILPAQRPPSLPRSIPTRTALNVRTSTQSIKSSAKVRLCG